MLPFSIWTWNISGTFLAHRPATVRGVSGSVAGRVNLPSHVAHPTAWVILDGSYFENEGLEALAAVLGERLLQSSGKQIDVTLSNSGTTTAKDPRSARC